MASAQCSLKCGVAYVTSLTTKASTMRRRLDSFILWLRLAILDINLLVWCTIFSSASKVSEVCPFACIRSPETQTAETMGMQCKLGAKTVAWMLSYKSGSAEEHVVAAVRWRNSFCCCCGQDAGLYCCGPSYCYVAI